MYFKRYVRAKFFLMSQEWAQEKIKSGLKAKMFSPSPLKHQTEPKASSIANARFKMSLNWKSVMSNSSALWILQPTCKTSFCVKKHHICINRGD